MSENINVGIGLVGSGYWGKNLVRVFAALGALKIICDINEEMLKKMKLAYPQIETTSIFENLLYDKSLAALVIATPAATHYQLAKQGLLAGKHVLVEKPLALSVVEGRDLVGLAEEKGLILMVGHLLLYHPAIRKLKELIGKGELGELRYISSNRLNFGKLRKNENVLWSFGPHDISVIVDLLGQPIRVRSENKSYLQRSIPDITLTFFEFENNRAAHIYVSWLNPFKEQKLSIVGSEKMAVFDGVANTLTLFSHRVEWDEINSPRAVKAEGENISFSNQEPLMEEARHFIECIGRNKPPLTSGKEALAVLQVLSEC